MHTIGDRICTSVAIGGKPVLSPLPRHAERGKPVRLVIQIPCYNEEECLPVTLSALPEHIPGVDVIETLVVDDGSTDDTVAVARASRVGHVVELPTHMGLAHAWSAGLEAALRAGADIIVNTDADNQYESADIAKLVRPILAGEADVVIGARPIDDTDHFSWLKKRLQRLGSWWISKYSGIAVPDAASGFRAYSRRAALALNTTGSYSHCIETIIRAARRGMAVRSVPVRTNEKLRESRLMQSTLHYLWRQSVDMFWVVTLLQPIRVFGLVALVLFLVGLGGFGRFLYFYLSGDGSGHVQSLLLSAVLIIVAFVVGMIGLAANMISENRQLIEEALARLKNLEMASRPAPVPDDEGDE